LISRTPVRGLPLAVLAVLLLTLPFAVSASAAPAAEGAATAPAAHVSLVGSGGKADRVSHGRWIRVSGRVEPRGAGVAVLLERSSRGRPYRSVARTSTRSDGSYRFRLRARRTATYRAVVAPAATASATTPAVASAARRVVVVARVAARASRHVLGGGAVRVRGRLRPTLRGRPVRLQLRTPRGWRTVGRSRTGRGGRFKASWSPPAIGRYALRVRFGGDRSAAATGNRLARVLVYRGSHASWYGPGLYGNSTACGGALTASRLGVAHRSLPCGTRVTFRYGSRSVTVPVIDRGPFAAGREWDLTAATKARLGFPDVGVVWSTR
jgi:rare lipoprotein A